MTDLVVIGAGGFGREVLDVVDAVNSVDGGPRWRCIGVVDDNPSARDLERLGRRQVAHLGGTGDMLAKRERPAYVVGIGAPPVRKRIAQQFQAAGFEAATLMHPSATVGSEVRLGSGTVICAGVRVSTNIVVGRHVHLNANATVGHDTVLGDFVSMNPTSSVSGDCFIGNEVLVGVGAVVLNRVQVGVGAVIGGAACVVHDVLPGRVVKGVPAR